ncbi:NepR family anti-sigma factor [Novosphingobium sp.]|uniref:NepR family anti-sigma factor n=2 Tax=Novosphingobium sp. TaxID=1874826 RepID=UPI00286BF4E4|nr:NepR family anti-sigma factor [Novosphingobium sp.]
MHFYGLGHGTNARTARLVPDMLSTNEMSDAPSKPTDQEKGAGKPLSDPDSRTITIGLKSLYRTVIEEPIPDDLMDLLNSLDDKG